MPVDPDVDRRDFYRLVTDSRNPLDLCLTMQDERVKALERTRQKNLEQYYDDYSEALTGD